jgi:fructose-bisphosphate aldolase class II
MGIYLVSDREKTMLVTLKDILNEARKNQYAVAAFDVSEDVMVRTVLETAQEKRSPVILMCLQMQLEGNGWAYLPGLIKTVADYHDIPIVLHLDHADSLEPVKKAVDCGFSSVMIDGSRLSFEENVEITAAAVEIAHPHGVSVEGELGHVGGMDLQDQEHFDSVLTQADEVVKFVSQTGVDALAVSIGTAHGVYRSLPGLNIEKLKELNAVSEVPLVLHGGSGTPDDQIRQAVKNGICKLNIFANQRVAMFRGLKESAKQDRVDPLPHQLFGPIRNELSKLVAEKIDLLMSGGRVTNTVLK